MLKPIITMACGMLLLFNEAAIAREIPINPITPDVKDKIKESVQLVSEVDQNIEPMVKDLEKIYASFEPCMKNQTDRGCLELKKQIGQKYEAVLDAIGQALPRLRQTLGATAQGLGQSIQRQVQREDLRSLYQHMTTKNASPRARGPLSQKLKQLLNAMGGNTNQSILELSLQTQADLVSATDMIDFLESKINHLTVMIELGQELPVMSQEMAQIMHGVADIFGYELDYVPEVLAEESDTATNSYGWHN